MNEQHKDIIYVILEIVALGILAFITKRGLVSRKVTEEIKEIIEDERGAKREESEGVSDGDKKSRRNSGK